MLAPVAFMKDDELFHFIKLMCECPIYDGYSAKCCKEKKNLILHFKDLPKQYKS